MLSLLALRTNVASEQLIICRALSNVPIAVTCTSSWYCYCPVRKTERILPSRGEKPQRQLGCIQNADNQKSVQLFCVLVPNISLGHYRCLKDTGVMSRCPNLVAFFQDGCLEVTSIVIFLFVYYLFFICLGYETVLATNPSWHQTKMNKELSSALLLRDTRPPPPMRWLFGHYQGSEFTFKR